MTYLLPPLPRTGDGADLAHIEHEGRPACGATLDAPYAVAAWLYAYRLCGECERAVRAGQAGLFSACETIHVNAQNAPI